MTRTRLFTAVLPTLIMIAIAACGPTGRGEPPAQSPSGADTQRSSAPQRTLVIAIRGELPSLAAKPLVPVTGALAPPTTLFNATLDFNDERGNPRPILAEALPQAGTDSWRVLPDGRMETTYKLKPNLSWHDGKPLTADDFVFAWRVYATPELGVATSPPIGQMEEVVAMDPRTVMIRWRQTYGEAGILQDQFQALPRHILGEQFQNLDPLSFSSLPFWTTEYVGLGPYKITTWEPGAYVDAAAFDGYVLGRPKIDRIRVQVFSDPNAAIAGILSQQVHFVGDFVFSETDGETLEHRWEQDHGGKVLYAPVELRLSVLQLRPEYADPPALLDVRVRRAIAQSIDASIAVEVLTGGKGLLTQTLSSPAADYYPEIEKVFVKHPYDPRQAATLIEEAGFVRQSNGFFADRGGKQLGIGVWSSSGAKNERENAIYTDSLKRSGFDATTYVFSAEQLRDAQARALIPGIGIRGFGQKRIEAYTSEQIPRPESRWQGDNRGGWSNPEFDQLFAAYVTTLDRTQRIQEIAQMERVFSADTAGIPHFFSAIVNAHVGSLQGPVQRTTPESGIGYLHVHNWEWRS